MTSDPGSSALGNQRHKSAEMQNNWPKKMKNGVWGHDYILNKNTSK